MTLNFMFPVVGAVFVVSVGSQRNVVEECTFAITVVSPLPNETEELMYGLVVVPVANSSNLRDPEEALRYVAVWPKAMDVCTDFPSTNKSMLVGMLGVAWTKR